LKDKIVIATRESLLALWQAEYVKKRIEDTYPVIQVELLPVTTKGDQILDRSLLEIGGKGLFIKELEKLLFLLGLCLPRKIIQGCIFKKVGLLYQALTLL